MKFPKVITVACEKGGVGKTTIATNLAVYLKALREDLPVTVLSFDNHFTVDRMFAIEKKRHEKSVKDLFDGGHPAELVELGQYGVSFIPSARRLDQPEGAAGKEGYLSEIFSESSIDGIVIMDTRPVLDFFSKSALLASDLVIIPIKDLPSLNNLKGITDLFDEEGVTAPEIRLIPSIVDGMVKFRNNTISMDMFLRSVSTERGYDLFGSSIAKSPKVESLTTNLTFEVYPIINHAKNTQAHGGFKAVATEVLTMMDEKNEPKSLLRYRKKHVDESPGNKKYRQLMETTIPYCPSCAEEVSARSLYIKPEMLYFESGSRTKGFIDIACLKKGLLDLLGKKSPLLKPLADQVAARIEDDATLCITVAKSGEDGQPDHLVMSLYDNDGERLAMETAEFNLSGEPGSLIAKMSEPTALGPAACLIRLGGRPIPDLILLEENYHLFQDAKMKILLDTNKKLSSFSSAKGRTTVVADDF